MNLKAETETEKRILEYLLANASPDLMARIDAEGKTMQGCMKYITSYAKAKIALDKRHGEVCVSVPPEEVFGQVMHYFEDEAEGAIYKSPEELKREAEAKVAAELREAKRKAEEEEARRKEEERLAALTPEEREAELKAKAEEEARRKLEEDLRREREAEERAKAEAERKAKEAEREAKEKRKREREEAKRKAAEAKERAEKMQPSLFDMMN